VYLFHAILKFDNEKEQRTFTRQIYLIIGVVFSFPKEDGNHDKSLIQVMIVHNRKETKTITANTWVESNGRGVTRL
jgi:hypothetical protein